MELDSDSASCSGSDAGKPANIQLARHHAHWCTELELSGRGLAVLPAGECRATHARALCLEDNLLESLPDGQSQCMRGRAFADQAD